MSKYEELIERLEKLAGPDRAVDRVVAKIAGWHRVEPRHTRSKHGAWIAPGDWLGEGPDGSPVLDSLHGTTMHRDVPAYTASIDAALTLVPEGWWIDARICKNRGADRAFCHITLEQDADTQGRDLADDEPLDVSAKNTPNLAIAICIAALKARMATS